MIRGARAIASVFGEAIRLTKPYFQSKERWVAIGLLAAIVAFTLLGVYLNVVYTYWYKIAYNALQSKDAAAFWSSMFTYRIVKGFPYFIPGFCETAVLTIVAAVYAFYMNQMLQIRWRRWLTKRLVNEWLDRHAHYRLSLEARAGTPLDNPDQRISDDVGALVGSNLSLALGLLSNVVTLITFTGVLWTIAPPLRIGSIVVHGYLVWTAIIYSAIGTVFTQVIGRRLVPLTFQQQQVEADFRYGLVRVRENTEQIALYSGEATETNALNGRFDAIYTNWWKIMKRTKALNFFTNGFAQVALVFPFVAAAPDYFTGVFTFGVLMQIGTIFGNVQGSLSWFVGAYTDLVAWRATVQRLSGFERAIHDEHVRADSNELTATTSGNALQFDDVDIALPDKRVLLEQQYLNIPSGTPIAVTGPSGIGKSTLFRTVAGIWPFARGRLVKPQGSMMFLPQRPYVPLGSLKSAVIYPAQEDQISDGLVVWALSQVGLSALAGRLHDVDAWTLRLSGGEQQRVALARAFIAAPDWLFMDEALSAIDEPSAVALFTNLAQKLPATQIVSITHQEAIAKLHPRRAVYERSTPPRISITDLATGDTMLPSRWSA